MTRMPSRHQGAARSKRRILRVVLAGSVAAAIGVQTLPALAQEGVVAPISLLDRPIPFTPAGADPRLAASFASRSDALNTFRFTPATANGESSKVRVALRSSSNRPIRLAESRNEVVARGDSAADLTPSTYNLGVDVGWKRVTLTGDVARTQTLSPTVPDREGAQIGVNYDLKKFSGQVKVSADRDTNPTAPAVTPTESYAVDVGGAVKVSRNIALTGGVRYRVDQERGNDPLQGADREDSQAVYVGGKLRF